MKGMSVKAGMTAAVMAGVLFAGSRPSAAEAPVIAGYVQGSYLKNLGNPKTAAGAPTGNQIRVFDQNQSDDFALNAVQLRVAKPVGEDGYGYTVKLLFGDDARVLNGNGTYATTNDQVYVQEAYGTFAVPSLKALTVTGGRFVTAEGVEVIESPLNLNITEGLLFGYAEPYSHTGVKANYVVNDMVNVTAGVANGWDNSNSYLDNNRGKTLLWQVATVPVKAMTANLQGTYGPEAASQTHQKRSSVDLVLGYTGIEKLTLYAQGNWGQDKQKDTATSAWKGVGFWAGYALNKCVNPAVRFEAMDDSNGASRFLVTDPVSGRGATIKNFTLTNKMVITDNMFVRAEYRHDWSNVAAFQDKAGNTVRVQNTIGADWVVLF